MFRVLESVDDDGEGAEKGGEDENEWDNSDGDEEQELKKKRIGRLKKKRGKRPLSEITKVAYVYNNGKRNGLLSGDRKESQLPFRKELLENVVEWLILSVHEILGRLDGKIFMFLYRLHYLGHTGFDPFDLIFILQGIRQNILPPVSVFLTPIEAQATTTFALHLRPLCQLRRLSVTPHPSSDSFRNSSSMSPSAVLFFCDSLDSFKTAVSTTIIGNLNY